MIAKDYTNIICDEDISKTDEVRRNPVLAKLILRSYARNLCTLAKKTTMLADVSAEKESASIATFDDYIGALERLYVIDGAKHLIEIRELVRQNNEKANQMPIRLPDLLIVLSGGEMAYTRPDGVKVMPLGCLKD